MDIEITTTKRKLTKALLAQMPQATHEAMAGGDVLGYILAVSKKTPKLYLISYNGEYYTQPADWERGKTAVYRKIGFSSQKLELGDKIHHWWHAYLRVQAQATVHIYI